MSPFTMMIKLILTMLEKHIYQEPGAGEQPSVPHPFEQFELHGMNQDPLLGFGTQHRC